MWKKIRAWFGYVDERAGLKVEIRKNRPGQAYHGPGQRVMGPQQPRPQVQRRAPSAPPRRSRPVYQDSGLTYIAYDAGSSSDSGSSGGCD